MKIEVLNWYKYQQKVRDNVETTWYRMDNNFLTMPGVFDICNLSKLVFVHMLGICSSKKNSEIRYSPELCARLLSSAVENIHTSIKELEANGMIRVIDDCMGAVTHADMGADMGADMDDAPQTDRQTNKHTNRQTNNNDDVPKNRALKVPKFSSWDMDIAKTMQGAIAHINPDSVSVHRVNIHKWANEFRLMRERDNLAESKIERVLDFTFKDDFWKAVVDNPKKMRKHWDKLTAKMKNRKDKSHDEVARRAIELLEEEERNGSTSSDVFAACYEDGREDDSNMGQVVDIKADR